MMLEETQVPFTEVRYTKETWPQAKRAGLANGTFPFGQVPSLTTHDGKDLVQTYGGG
jgi:glutathione S-transferase